VSVRRRLVAVVGAVALLASIAPGSAVAASVTGIDVELPSGVTVSGRVLDDNGAGVPFAPVGLCAGPFDCFVIDTIADAAGDYVIRGVEEGTYLVAATRPEAPANFLEIAYYAVGGSVLDPEQASEVEVGPDGLTGIDIALATGLVLSGRTIDSNGDPVAGAFVNACGDASCGLSVISDATGAYQVVGLAPNQSYRLSVEAPAGGPFPSGEVGSGMTTGPDEDGATIPVADTDVSGVDITLTRGNSISGHLDGDLGAGVFVEPSGDFNARQANVDQSGDFTVFVWPGTYQLFFGVAGPPEDGQFPYGLYNGQGEVLINQNEAGVQVDASAGDVTSLSAVLPDLPSISGLISGESGAVSTAFVSACSEDAGCAFMGAPGGVYEFVNLPPGDYAILAGSSGRVPSYYATSGSVPDAEDATLVHVDASDVPGIDIVLPDGSSIAGRITGPEGEPVVGAFVLAIPSSGGISQFGPGSAETDSNGDYVITGLVDDTYRIHVTPVLYSGYKDGYWSESGYTDDFDQAGQIVVANAPTIADATPGAGATGVARGANVTFTTSSAVTGVSKATFQVRDGRTNRLVAGKVSYDAATRTATFDPTAPLGRRTTYVVRVLAGITDAAGNPLEPTTWSFTTGT
jgi:hypothetical protein